MAHYFDGLPISNNPVLQVIADNAELTLIGCGIPLSRRVGLIAFDTIKGENGEDDQSYTLRRFADDPSLEGVGNNWRLIDTYATKTHGDEIVSDDEDDNGPFIGMPVYALKALRAGGHNLNGFSIYHEGIDTDRDGQKIRVNDMSWSRYHELRPTADYIDAWKPQTMAEREAFAAEIAEHQAWLAVI